jgi:hypothetical protein
VLHLQNEEGMMIFYQPADQRLCAASVRHKKNASTKLALSY